MFFFCYREFWLCWWPSASLNFSFPCLSPLWGDPLSVVTVKNGTKKSCENKGVIWNVTERQIMLVRKSQQEHRLLRAAIPGRKGEWLKGVAWAVLGPFWLLKHILPLYKTASSSPQITPSRWSFVSGVHWTKGWQGGAGWEMNQSQGELGLRCLPLTSPRDPT